MVIKSYSVESISNLYKDRILELQEEPEFQWKKDSIKHAMDDKGEPQVKIAIGNVSLDHDLWKGLRNPATLGLHPAGLKEIWNYYANKRRDRVDAYGRQSIFQVPKDFEYAKKKYKRALIISMMLPFSHEIIKGYNNAIRDDRDRSSYIFRRMYEDMNKMANKATGRVGIELTSVNDAVLAMTDDNIGKVTKEAIPTTQQGASHGPSKGGNYPQKSLAVLMGLGQFGVSRIVFRDEVHDNQVDRYVGPIRSIVLFDEEEPVKNGKGGIIYPSDEWKEFLYRLTDYTDIKPDINKHRYCTYIPQDDAGCSKCIEFCPSGAQENSVPLTNGEYSKQVSRQSHRFWEDQLQFDYAKCCEIRGQMAALFPEWSCARCVTICAEEGNRRKKSVQNYYEKKLKLTTISST
jgi:hypothetical protein